MEKLRQVLAQEDTVLFVGSGISLWSGLPSWPGLIEQLAGFVESAGANAALVRSEAKKGELLQAASYGFDKLTKHQIGDFVRTACQYGAAKPHEIHRLLVSLGPRCFITTNYDNLIEESLRRWQADRFIRPPITNRHLTETAEIVHARSIDFIFKPHGDAADSESIILTREQYRQLLPGGERQAALESLKMLMASRPIVYVGFGLRDPDFLYVRDLLANTYKGGTRDHYAIMADISNAESDYWRRNYGIHLISYATAERADRTRDHTALLTLLATLIPKAPELATLNDFDPCSPHAVLALARHAAGLTRSPKLTPEFKIRVNADEGNRRGKGAHYYRLDKYDHNTVERFLDEGPERALLIGLPGAGKTYSLRQAAARMAETLHEACLSEPFDEKGVVVPIFADLKLYHGDIGELVSQMLPKNLPLHELQRHYRIKIFLDSFNEIPREYWESGQYESDFTNFIKSIGSASLVIGSRTTDGLDKLGLPAYCLDEIDDADVVTELQRLGIKIEGRFGREVRQLLQRPFYFQYILSGAVILPAEAHPRDFYRAFFVNLHKTFATRFSNAIDIEEVLSFAAYDALNRGEEAFPLSELLRVLKTSVETAGVTDVDVRDIANWLVSSSVMIPHTSGRIAFVHQSVTEYLAAAELARRYQSSSHILEEKLSLTRWDQALFLTLSLLPPAKADVFFGDVVKADFALAADAAKYLEVGRDEVVSRLLLAIPKRMQDRGPFDHETARALEFRLPLTDAHEPHLRALIEDGGIVGAAAVGRLVALKGEKVKGEILQLLVDHRDDYNFCANGIGMALQPYATEKDAATIAEWANSIQESAPLDSEDEDTDGFRAGAALFLAKIDLSVIRRSFLPADRSMPVPAIHGQILCDVLDDRTSTEALDFAGELLLRGVNRAAMAIYFIGKYSTPECKLSWASFSAAHVDRLLSMLDGPVEETAALEALECLCAGRPDLAEVVKDKVTGRSGIAKAALLYCLSPSNLAPVFQALWQLTEMSDEERHEQPLGILSVIQFDWTGRGELFVDLLRLRDVRLARAMFGGSCPPSFPNLGILKIGPIDWWLEWMTDVWSNDDTDWFCNQLSALFAEHLNREVRDKFVSEFNRSNSKYRPLLLRFVLPYWSDVTTEDFGEDAISFVLADLSREECVSSFPEHLLCRTATERFIDERLLPLLPDAKQPLLKNLHEVLKEAGSRHGRRYLLEKTN